MAQFKVEIKNLRGETTHGAEFSTMKEAENWIMENEPNGAWGKLERFVPLNEASDQDRADAVEVIPANEETKEPSMLRLRRNFEVVGPIDITAEKEQAAEAENTKKQRKLVAMERVKEFQSADLDSATTIAQLRARMKVILEDIVQIIKE